MIGAGRVRGVRLRPPAAAGHRPAGRAGHRGGDRLLQRHGVGATGRRRTRRPAARTSTGGSGSGTGGGSPPGGDSWSGRPPRARRWRSTFATYAVPGPSWAQRAVAVAAVLGLAALNYRGVTRTALLTRVLVATSLTALAVVVVGIAAGGRADPANLGGWSALGAGGPYGILQAAGLLFFAFAGYARIATMGEEVRDPQRTIPRAIPHRLVHAVAVYLVVGVAALLAAGPDRLAAATAPLTTAVAGGRRGRAAPVVRVGAALAALGALLALIAGIGRTSLAMARHRDLPGWLAAVHPRYRVPHHAEIALAVVVGVLVLTADLRGVIGFSSFGVLLYYAIANAAAFTQPADQRRWPRWLNVLGAAGCLDPGRHAAVASVLAGTVTRRRAGRRAAVVAARFRHARRWE